ncbi:MAG: hypothetical protein KC582_02675 [Candidatus Magasanikbacteria bacterium]|nr:hypothetical protein [Candidatus Magasanikbacteria bacterium]MCA9389711.1 hypothetical protein [Candidatus Magasanikbacteria bacterium]MCA9391134.1 hypothetical protein [Candidatus Magasanikbacteria bacterium]USN52646.1 MAG: hypothetical protein H6759_01010 [Candidatus Nomurabacteria bacterium]HPF95484.1 hypothetical protein [bacterium]
MNKILKLVRQFSIALGILLIWRGLWYALDYVDKIFFNGNSFFTVVGGIIIGILILYLPDGDLKELGKL